MFNKEKFSNILKNIYDTYNNQRDFALATGVNRGYLSQYINMKLDSPPSPKILMKIALASNEITTYEELMNICGFLLYEDKGISKIQEASKVLTYENMINIEKLNDEEKEIVYNINKLYDLNYEKGLSIEESEKEALCYFDKLDLSEAEQSKMKNLLKKYIVSKSAHRIIQKIYEDKSKIDLHYNYIDLRNKLDALIQDFDDDEKINFKESMICVPVLKNILIKDLFSKNNIDKNVLIDKNFFDINIKEKYFIFKECKNNYFLIKKQEKANNEEIVLILKNKKSYIKKYRKLNDQFVVLENINNNKFVEEIDIINLDELNFKIIGKVIGNVSVY